mmetsp:Transcript_10177/g.19063  ORF Transcript_10177/g.19063 Transcript_10177/m.19063 type:complete len:93 (-) Transcript_10177:83-361(-)
MGPDSIPDKLYCQQHIFINLRQLSFQSLLSWKTVLECARSIEFDATCHDEENQFLPKDFSTKVRAMSDIYANVTSQKHQIVSVKNTPQKSVG